MSSGLPGGPFLHRLIPPSSLPTLGFLSGMIQALAHEVTYPVFRTPWEFLVSWLKPVGTWLRRPDHVFSLGKFEFLYRAWFLAHVAQGIVGGAKTDFRMFVCAPQTCTPLVTLAGLSPFRICSKNPLGSQTLRFLSK